MASGVGFDLGAYFGIVVPICVVDVAVGFGDWVLELGFSVGVVSTNDHPKRELTDEY